MQAHGPDTERLLQIFQQCDGTELNVPLLNITSLPELPASLQILTCPYTQVTVLPELPASLQRLWCHNTVLTFLPALPASLQELYCDNCPNLLLIRGDGESIADYEARWKPVREEIASKERMNTRCWQLEKDLLEAVYHPDRVIRWLEEAGHEFLDTVFDVHYSFNRDPVFRTKKNKVVPEFIK